MLEKYVGRQYLDNTQDKTRSLNSYFVQDARANYKLPNKLFNQLTFFVVAYNIFNKKYEPNGYTFSYIYGGQKTTENFYFPMAGRNFMAGINLKFWVEKYIIFINKQKTTLHNVSKLWVKQNLKHWIVFYICHSKFKLCLH